MHECKGEQKLREDSLASRTAKISRSDYSDQSYTFSTHYIIKYRENKVEKRKKENI